MSKQIFLLALFFACSIAVVGAQVDKNSDLFIELKKQDSIFFERGFNRCDLTYLESKVSDNLRFFHDQGGFQDRDAFFENTKKYICPNMGKKPVRQIQPGSLEVYPLYSNGELYGAIQKGVHHFYMREAGKEDIWTGVAKFIHVWVLEGGDWKLSEVLSYDHQNSLSKE